MTLLFPSERHTIPSPSRQRWRRTITPAISPPPPPPEPDPDPFGIATCCRSLAEAQTETGREAALYVWIMLHWGHWEAVEAAAGRVPEIPPAITEASHAARHHLAGCDNCTRHLPLTLADGWHLCAECAEARATEGPLSCEVGIGADLSPDD